MSKIENSFDEITKLCKQIAPERSYFEKLKADSLRGLAYLINDDRSLHYDLILIDAGHQAKNALTDITTAWRLLKPGGIMIIVIIFGLLLMKIQRKFF